jgi:chemotaxis protein methyltransferase CheR
LRRQAQLGVGVAAYRARLEADPAEWAVLERLCRVTISRFWRDRGLFEALRDEVLNALGPDVVAWSAGCASGEEAYSLVLAADEAGVRLRVLATDVDPVLLDRARRASYPESSLRELPSDLRLRAFEAHLAAFVPRHFPEEGRLRSEAL